MASVGVLSCRCMFVSCVHPVAVLIASCLTFSLLMLVADAIWKRHTPKPVS